MLMLLVSHQIKAVEFKQRLQIHMDLGLMRLAGGFTLFTGTAPPYLYGSFPVVPFHLTSKELIRTRQHGECLLLNLQELVTLTGPFTHSVL
jgi:hypothetical protein